jgi:hypothetical protein
MIDRGAGAVGPSRRSFLEWKMGEKVEVEVEVEWKWSRFGRRSQLNRICGATPLWGTEKCFLCL